MFVCVWGGVCGCVDVGVFIETGRKDRECKKGKDREKEFKRKKYLEISTHENEITQQYLKTKDEEKFERDRERKEER